MIRVFEKNSSINKNNKIVDRIINIVTRGDTVIENIKDIISKGETINVEFKSWKKVKEKELMKILTKEAVGMANTKGGIILVGVEDDGEITGCENYDTQEVINELRNYGYIESNGFKKYILSEKVYYGLGDDVGYIKDKDVEYIRAKDMIEQYLKKNESINNSKVRELCNCDGRKAKYYIDKMVKESLIEAKGSNRYRVYIKK